MNDTLYIKMGQSVELTASEVTIGDVAKLECGNRTVLNKLKPIKLLQDDSDGRKRYIVSIMKIIEIINEVIPGIAVQNLGDTECVVEFKKGNSSKNIWEILKTIAVCFILFFGVGFSIMSFNNDVGIDAMFEQVSLLFTGDAKEAKGLVEYCYSIGLGVGIIIFYNHFGAKKLSKDPTPIEVEMRKYEMEINQTLIDGHNREDGKLDVRK